MQIFNNNNYLGMASSLAIIKPLKVQSSYNSVFIRFWEHKHFFNIISANNFNAVKKTRISHMLRDRPRKFSNLVWKKLCPIIKIDKVLPGW